MGKIIGQTFMCISFFQISNKIMILRFICQMVLTSDFRGYSGIKN